MRILVHTLACENQKAPMPVTLEEKSILTTNCDCKKARALGGVVRVREVTRGRFREKGEGLPLPSQPPGKLSPLRLPHQGPLT